MDKETLSNYGWVVIAVLVLSIMIALATPFGSFIRTAVENTTQGLFDVQQKAMGVAGLIIDDQNFNKNTNNNSQETGVNEYGFYYNKPYGGREDSLDDFLVFLTFYDNGVCTYTDMSGQGMTMNYKVQMWSDFFDDFVQSQGGASEEELNEINEYFASMGITPNSVALIATNGDEVMPIGVVISETEIQTLISDCNVYSCESNDFTVIGEYGYVISKDGSCYQAMVTDRNKTTYSTPKSEVLGKPVILYGTYYGCKNLTSITISSDIAEIGESAFDGCESLVEVNIQNGITKIGESAFENCTSLKTINVPSSVVEIDTSAFYECTNLTSVILPEGLTDIDSIAFAKCEQLSSIIIPSTVDYIGPEAFKDCTSLNSITFNGTLEQWDKCIQGQRWNQNVPATKVICSDGEVTL